MTEIKLWNTRTRTKVPFRPLDAKNVRMYVCGPTVYDRAHIGNARPVVVFDVLFRLLRHVYGEKSVTYVRNFTDVDDKINARAAETGRDIRAITDETIRWYHEDMGALGALRPTHEPRATEYIAQMVAMTGELVARGNAYVAEGHVLFDVNTYADYGSLSNRALDDMIAGARVEVAPYKRNPMDFVLWKPSAKGEPAWDGPKVNGAEVSKGRPGWHIECSAMAKDLLGEHFDIHAGGIDLMFPHHENELAQSNCLHGGEMAQVWMHNGFLEVEGQKMSKSLGNFFTVRDLLEKGYPGEVIRFVLLGTHYRSPMDWTERKAEEARKTLRKWVEAMDIAVKSGGQLTPSRSPLPEGFQEYLSDDLNTHGALLTLDLAADEVLKAADESPTHYEGSRLRQDDATKFRNALYVIGFGNLADFKAGEHLRRNLHSTIVKRALDRRAAAKSEKNFALADELRNQLATAGILLMDTADGTKWEFGANFDPSKLPEWKSQK